MIIACSAAGAIVSTGGKGKQFPSNLQGRKDPRYFIETGERQMKKRLLNMQEFLDYVGLGRTKGTEWAKEIGAMKRIGRRTFFDVVIIDKALDELAGVSDGMRK